MLKSKMQIMSYHIPCDCRPFLTSNKLYLGQEHDSGCDLAASWLRVGREMVCESVTMKIPGNLSKQYNESTIFIREWI